MTVEHNQAEVAEVAGSVSGIVLTTTQRVLDVYKQAKDLSPMLKNSLESVETRVPESFVDRIQAVSAPVLTDLDERYETLSQAVVKTVADVDEIIRPVRAAIDEKIIEPVASTCTKTITNVSGAVTKTVADVQNVQWKDLRGDLTKKAVARLEQGFVDVKEFSATRGKDMIHIDLIEYSQLLLDNGVKYSQSVVDNARTAATPLLVPVTEQVIKATEVVRTAVLALQEAVVERSSQTSEKLTARLAAAKEASMELGQKALELVQAKYGEVQAKLPDKEVVEQALMSRLPANLHPSVQVILNSPAVFSKVIAKADLATSKKAMDNMKALVAAVKEVVFAPVVEVEVVAE